MKKISPDTFLSRLYEMQTEVTKDAHVAKLFGKPPRLVRDWRDRGSIPYGRCTEIASILNIDLDELLGKTDEIVKVPEYNDVPVSVGDGAFALSEKPTGYIEFPLKLFKHLFGAKGKDYIQLPVEGDSMTPTLNDGDKIMVHPQTDYTGEGIYTVRYDGNMYVKRLIKENNNTYTLKSNNPQYNDIKTNNHTDFAIIGKVLWLGREL